MNYRPHRGDTRVALLHELYLSVGRGNDAILAGRPHEYEREIAKQCELRGRIARTDVVKQG